MDTTQFAEGLRQIADWYEAHPDVALPELRLTVYCEHETKERIAELVRMLGSLSKDFSLPELFALERDFNGVLLRFVFYRATVCTPRVVGQKTIPAVPATPERTEPIYEWDCHAILAEPQATAP